jgi:hypothetical protein
LNPGISQVKSCDFTVTVVRRLWLTTNVYVPKVALYQAKLRPDLLAEGVEPPAEVCAASRKGVSSRSNRFDIFETLQVFIE